MKFKLRNSIPICYQASEQSFHRLRFCPIHLYPIAGIGLCKKHVLQGWHCIIYSALFFFPCALPIELGSDTIVLSDLIADSVQIKAFHSASVHKKNKPKPR